jgi:hypothetical protein
MAARNHHGLSLAVLDSPNGRNLGFSHVQHGKTGLKPLLMAWFGVIVLAVNLFGWTQTSLTSPSDTVVSIFDDVPICEHGTDSDGSRHNRQSDDHGKLLCPACFPLGNATSGGLVSTSPAILASTKSFVVARIQPDDWTAPSSFVPHPYQARGPPQIA